MNEQSKLFEQPFSLQSNILKTKEVKRQLDQYINSYLLGYGFSAYMNMLGFIMVAVRTV